MTGAERDCEWNMVNERQRDWKMSQKSTVSMSGANSSIGSAMLDYLDKLLVDKQFEAVLSRINVYRETAVDVLNYPDSAHTPVTLRELEARLMLGYTRGDSGRTYPSDSHEEPRWRILYLFEHLVDERYKDIVDEYELFDGPKDTTDINRFAYDLCLWLLGEKPVAPEITQLTSGIVDSSPIADSLVTYLVLVTTRALNNRRLDLNAPDPVAFDIISKLEVPASVELLLGEYWDILGLIDPLGFLAIRGTSVHAPALTYSEACIRTRTAMLYVADGNVAIAAVIATSLAGAHRSTTSLDSRIRLLRFLIGLEMGTSKDSVKDLVRTQGTDSQGLFSLYSDDIRIIVTCLRISVTPKAELDWLRVLVYLLVFPRLTPTNVFPVVLERCCDGLDMLMNHGMMLEAAQLMEAIDYCMALDAEKFSTESVGRVVVLSEMWALCSRKRSPISLETVASNPPQSARALLNQAHALYERGDTDGANAIAVRIDLFDPLECPLDWHRHALIRMLTDSRASASQLSVFSLDLSYLTSEVATSLMPLFMNCTQILAQAGEWESSRDILTALVGKLASSREIQQCNFYLAECYEATGNHWKAAKLFGELSKHDYFLSCNGISIEGLARYRLAKNLFLDFKHQHALTHLEKLLATTQAYGDSGLANRLKIMRMVCICHEVLDALPAAKDAWVEFASLLTDQPEHRTEYVNALNRIAVLNFRSGDYDSASDFFSRAHTIYKELFGKNDGKSKQALLHIGMCELHLRGETPVGATFAHAKVSSDVQRQEVGL